MKRMPVFLKVALPADEFGFSTQRFLVTLSITKKYIYIELIQFACLLSSLLFFS